MARRVTLLGGSIVAFFTFGALVVGCAKGSVERDVLDEDEDGSGPVLDGSSTADGATRPRDGSTGDANGGRDATTSPDGATPDGAVVVDGSTPDGAVVVDASPGDAGTCVTVAPNNVCGLNPQCGCSATQTCDITTPTTGAATCIAAGAQPQGQSCTTASNCARGLTCWNGACRPYCTRGQTTCTGGGICFAPTGSSGGTSPNLDVCSVTCDLRSPSTVCGTNGCSYFSSQRATDCRPPGPGVEYDDCLSDADCRQGFVCGNDPVFGPVCSRWCRLGSNADCALGDTCTDAYGVNAPTSGANRLGICFF